MSQLQEIKAEFTRIFEGIADRRGLPVIIGRMMAAFFLEGRELNQKELSDITGYSLSSVSRAVERMVQMGIVHKHKAPSREHFVYNMKIDYRDLAVGGLEAWIRHAELSKNEIESLRRRMENLDFREENQAEASRLHTTLTELEKNTEIVLEIIRRDVKELRTLKT